MNLTVKFTDDPTDTAVVVFSSPAGFDGKDEDHDYAATTYTRPGTYNATLTVSDGHSTVSKSLTINVTSQLPMPPIYNITMAVDYPCEQCSQAAGGNFVGAIGCTGFASDSNGTDCAWALMIYMDGMEFLATSTGGDPDLEFRSSCEPDPRYTLGFSIAPGPAAGTVPPGARCVVLWEHRALDSAIQFRVWRPGTRPVSA